MLVVALIVHFFPLSRYVDALVQLYEDYNPIYGDPKVKLIVG